MERGAIAHMSIQSKLWHYLSSPFAGLVLALSLAISSIPLLEANATEIAPTHKQVHVRSDASEASETASSTSDFPEDGTYLYGQSPEANQIGVSYAVMEVHDRTAVGAFYMPDSSFDCFYGEVGSDQLDLTIVNSYGQNIYAYSVPLTQDATVAATDSSLATPQQLAGYHPISNLSDVDHQILSTCRANYSKGI